MTGMVKGMTVGLAAAAMALSAPLAAFDVVVAEPKIIGDPVQEARYGDWQFRGNRSSCDLILGEDEYINLSKQGRDGRAGIIFIADDRLPEHETVQHGRFAINNLTIQEGNYRTSRVKKFGATKFHNSNFIWIDSDGLDELAKPGSTLHYFENGSAKASWPIAPPAAALTRWRNCASKMFPGEPRFYTETPVAPGVQSPAKLDYIYYDYDPWVFRAHKDRCEMVRPEVGGLGFGITIVRDGSVAMITLKNRQLDHPEGPKPLALSIAGKSVTIEAFEFKVFADSRLSYARLMFANPAKTLLPHLNGKAVPVTFSAGGKVMLRETIDASAEAMARFAGCLDQKG